MRTLCAVIQWISAAVEHARWQPPDQTMFLDTEDIERGKNPVEIAGCRERCDTSCEYQTTSLQMARSPLHHKPNDVVLPACRYCVVITKRTVI
jgi:hypothetical protein